MAASLGLIPSHNMHACVAAVAKTTIRVVSAADSRDMLNVLLARPEAEIGLLLQPSSEHEL